jgi:3-oxoacyl-[acyl-carrier protein] reductase
MKKFLAICMMICLLAVSVFAASDPYDDLDAAVAASGLNPLQANIIQDSIDGMPSGNAAEEFQNLFDDDVTTKYGIGSFPSANWEMDKEYILNGLICATANDNSSYTGRNAEFWTLSGSTDNENWEVIAEGTQDDFEDTDFTYYTITFNNDKAYKYYMWESDGSTAGFFQMSELVPCGTEAGAAAPAAVEEAPAEEAPVAEEAPAEVAPAEEAPAAPVTTAPATFDVMSVVVIAAAASLIAALAVKKRAVK